MLRRAWGALPRRIQAVQAIFRGGWLSGRSAPVVVRVRKG